MSAIHALLVGVDRYRPERFPDGRPIPPLAGAVNDALRVRSFLESGPFAVPRERVRWLLSPHPWATSAPPADGLPTLRNLIREIRRLGGRAASGDQVLIHYSGHGARLPTAVPEVKGQTAWDECLVPCDAGAEGGGFLRDVELHALIEELTSRDLLVSLVLDCCHAGGLTRAWFRSHVRGLGKVSIRPDPESPLGAWGDLAAPLLAPDDPPAGGEGSPAWRRLDPEPGWLPMPEGCVVLAACASTELAREYPFGAGGYNGALTHVLLRTLGDSHRTLTYRELHHRLLGRIRSLSCRQTPALLGDGDRIFLAGERRSAPSAAAALRAVLVDPARGLPVSHVKVAASDSVGPEGRHVLERLAEILADGGVPLATIEAWPERGADLEVEITADGCLRVADGAGRSLALSEGPVETAPHAVVGIAERLAHVAHYRAVERLSGPAAGAALADSIDIALFSLDRIEDWQSPSRRAAVDPSCVRVGTLLCLLIRNRAERELSIAVLDVSPDWGIRRIHPYPGDGECTTLDPGGAQPVFFRAELPAGVEEGRDRIQVLVATRPMATGHLEREALAEGPEPRAPTGESEALPSSLGSVDPEGTEPTGRGSARPEDVWTVSTVDLRLRRPRPDVTETWWTAAG